MNQSINQAMYLSIYTYIKHIFIYIKSHADYKSKYISHADQTAISQHQQQNRRLQTDVKQSLEKHLITGPNSGATVTYTPLSHS